MSCSHDQRHRQAAAEVWSARELARRRWLLRARARFGLRPAGSAPVQARGRGRAASLPSPAGLESEIGAERWAACRGTDWSCPAFLISSPAGRRPYRYRSLNGPALDKTMQPNADPQDETVVVLSRS